MAFDPTEPDTVLLRRVHVRRDDDLEAVTEAIMNLIDDDEMIVVDLSRHDRRADVIELRSSRLIPRSQS
jgi:hypothetical protein